MPWPRSPCTARLIQRQYWTSTGLSSPYACLKAWRCSGRASGGSKARSGLPVRRAEKKIATLTTHRVNRAWSNRVMRNFHMVTPRTLGRCLAVPHATAPLEHVWPRLCRLKPEIDRSQGHRTPAANNTGTSGPGLTTRGQWDGPVILIRGSVYLLYRRGQLERVHDAQSVQVERVGLVQIAVARHRPASFQTTGLFDSRFNFRLAHRKDTIIVEP